MNKDQVPTCCPFCGCAELLHVWRNRQCGVVAWKCKKCGSVFRLVVYIPCKEEARE